MGSKAKYNCEQKTQTCVDYLSDKKTSREKGGD